MPATASDALKTAFGKRLKEARENAQIKQGALAAACGWEKESQSRISMYERGDRWPAMDDIIKLAEVLGVSAQYLIFGKTKGAPIAQPIATADDLTLLRQFKAIDAEMRAAIRDVIVNAHAMTRQIAKADHRAKASA